MNTPEQPCLDETKIMTSVNTVIGGNNVAATILFMASRRLCSLQAYEFLARSYGAIKPYTAVLNYRWLKIHLYRAVMLLVLGAGMVLFSFVRFFCVMRDCSKDKETNLDFLNIGTSDAYSKMYQNKGSGPLVSVIKSSEFLLF